MQADKIACENQAIARRIVDKKPKIKVQSMKLQYTDSRKFVQNLAKKVECPIMIHTKRSPRKLPPLTTVDSITLRGNPKHI